MPRHPIHDLALDRLHTQKPTENQQGSFCGARCHVIQSGLRPGGGKGYAIPRGFLFEYVTCANYCAEVYGWIAFTVATQTVAPGIFILCGTAQMIPWAAGKHARLRKVGPLLQATLRAKLNVRALRTSLMGKVVPGCSHWMKCACRDVAVRGPLCSLCGTVSE